MLEQLLILVILEKVYLVKMCPIFDGSPLAFGARYQSFLRVCWYLPVGVTNFVYPSEKFNNLTDINVHVFEKRFKWLEIGGMSPYSLKNYWSLYMYLCKN